MELGRLCCTIYVSVVAPCDVLQGWVKGAEMGHSRDKEKKESKKKAKHDVKEKRKLKKERKQPRNTLTLTKHSGS